MNKKFMEPEMEISAFEVEDIVTVSGDNPVNTVNDGPEFPVVYINWD